MAFQSILFESIPIGVERETAAEPACFSDLNLDQIVDSITAGRQEYNLKPFFYTPLRDMDTIIYRQQVMQDLENETLLEHIKSFAQTMRIVRRYLTLAEKLDFQYHREGWFLEAVEMYCQAVTCLVHDLHLVDLRSRGLLACRDYLTAYIQADAFTQLEAEAKNLGADLSAIRYCVVIRGSLVQVRKYEDEIDYSADVEATFAKFEQRTVKDYRVQLPARSGMSHIEGRILDLVARLYSGIFARLDAFCARYDRFLDETIVTFDREVEFYVAYVEYIARIKRAKLPFCYPQLSEQSKNVHDNEGFDLALASKLVNQSLPVVCNDFYLVDPERILVVSGPNQGGKTTFARMFGQLHYLASLGCPVPGREARLFLCDRIWTHFEREEDIRNLRGKLQDDLVRIHAILEQATPNSIILVNEIFTSTTLEDALFLGQRVLEKIIQLDSLCICVTFLDELASLSDKTVSMVSTIAPENPALRTYRIVRRPADGLAYAISIAQKYRLTYDQLKERIHV